MRKEIQWLDAALSSKEIVVVMTHYRVKDCMMTATNGRIVAGHPIDMAGEFLVPGKELEAIFKRLPDEPTVKIEEGKVTLRSGRFNGTLDILPQTEWTFPDQADPPWVKFPEGLLTILKDLRPFISDTATYPWSLGVSLDDGWCYSSNNIVLAGAPFPECKGMKLIIPAWALDFLLTRKEGLTHWAYSDTFIAFKWQSGAWMRSTLLEGQFPEKAGTLIREAPKCTQKIEPEYKTAVRRVAGLADDHVSIYKDRIEARTQRASLKEGLKSEVPKTADHSMWTASSLLLMIEVANEWSPGIWPAPVPFRGDRIRGYIAGRVG